ncbi:uncharacterized protein LOC135105194 [Scylla paramamosain]|uniref:uncharacterized protein LOC135105194 n=1 Tax=Scylla paramamosain TaxID=85552 RepID=UPI0030838EA3
MVVWDINTVKKVIEEYRERRVLWDLCDPAYKDNKKKVKIWEDLAKVFNCDVKEIKDKVKNLRTTFHKYRKKKSGSATSEQWIHYNSLTFLLEVDAPKKGLSTEEDISQIDDETCTSDDQLTEIGEAFQEEGDRDLEEFAKPVPYSGKKKRRVASRDTDAKRADEAYEIMKAASNRDDCAIYGEYVASELRKLSGYSQMMVKHAINNILFEGALGKYDKPNPTQFPVPVPTSSPIPHYHSPVPSPIPHSHSPVPSPIPHSHSPVPSPLSVPSPNQYPVPLSTPSPIPLPTHSPSPSSSLSTTEIQEEASSDTFSLVHFVM